MMAPGYLLYAIVCRKDLRAAILPGIMVIGIAILYFGGRELSERGYLHAVWLQDVTRFNEPAEKGNGRDVVEYISQLFLPWQALLLIPQWNPPFYVPSAFPWSLIALLALIRPSRAVTYLFCCLAPYIFVISIAATHHPWYVAPTYPLIAVLAALGVQRTIEIAQIKLLFPFFAAISVLCVALNVWKFDRQFKGVMMWRETGQASLIRALPRSARVMVRPDIVWRTPAVRNGTIVGTELYFGAIEFYRRQRPAGSMEIECAAVPFAHDTGRAVPTSCHLPNDRPKGPVIRRLPDSQFISNP
jgi:hypothetical protein